MPLQSPTPDGVLELFRDEIVVREAEIDPEFRGLLDGRVHAAWEHPFPGVETMSLPGGPTLIRVTFKRLINQGGYEDIDRIRHELRNLKNDIRAATPSNAQAEFGPPQITHVERPDGLEILCYTQGIVRERSAER